MNQMSLFSPPIWTVTHITRFIKNLLEGEDTLQDIWVQGEVSNFSRPSSGHIYFTLKDANATLRCVMWRHAAQQQKQLPQDGARVEVHGSIGVYEVGGQYQLYADEVRPLGEGLLFQEFLRLRSRLEQEGLFSVSRKRTLPTMPKTIGVVTSPTGAAIRDILHTIERRFPLTKVILAPCQVQGEAAPLTIVSALTALNAIARPDVIILARGGGSLEDLWAFNDERVARAIASSQAPVVSGVGHETDFTIADFVADVRAPTPTAAAEIATPDKTDLKANLINDMQKLQTLIQDVISSKRLLLSHHINLLRQYIPLTRLRSSRQRLDEISHQTRVSLYHAMNVWRTHLNGLYQRLSALDPNSILARGYAIVTKPSGQTVSSIQQVRKGDDLSIQVSDGSFMVSVSEG